MLNKSRTEDTAIAYTWYHFLFHQDQPEYILRLPMTKVRVHIGLSLLNYLCLTHSKAVVRAMDTVADFGKKKVPSLNITKFVVAGASKVHAQS